MMIKMGYDRDDDDDDDDVRRRTIMRMMMGYDDDDDGTLHSFMGDKMMERRMVHAMDQRASEGAMDIASGAIEMFILICLN